ncbi:zinc ABC transporter ATP-binding protein ZnuC [Ahrensia sp. R2A130]|uniref:zinc ABC transporter ATP-binding protein ZnuC n=1 Tax=Ahrensia sp. R2A130 TaxID=744979 RepID=UPI0001E0AD0A|nr:zinc ABC transporter ATP-binding protein ZnuC [Ahrensia sp. R2A130]EFL87773.1 probable metal transport system ATP-binding protein [Ahrensia sp. R2A130]
MSERNIIELKQAGFRAGERWAVRDVSFTVQPGEIVTLIGPNGSGKSTTAKLALGITKPTAGTATRTADLTIGYVPQKMSIDWTLPLTVSRFMRLTDRLTSDETLAALQRTGVAQLVNDQMRTLSGGEFQRVLLARAIARKPDLLVLDEPAQGVDFQGEIELYQLIGDLRNELNCGVLMISHDLHLVMAQTDKVICLNGHMCCAGTPTTVTESDDYRNLFGTRAGEALAIYQHSHDHKHLPDGTVQLADGTVADHCDTCGTEHGENS